MWPNPQETMVLVTFTEDILNGKLHFLYSVTSTFTATKKLRDGASRTLSNRAFCEKYWLLLAVNCFDKTLNLRCITGLLNTSLELNSRNKYYGTKTAESNQVLPFYFFLILWCSSNEWVDFSETKISWFYD